MTAIFWDGGTWSGSGAPPPTPGTITLPQLSTPSAVGMPTGPVAVFADVPVPAGSTAYMDWGDGSPVEAHDVMVDVPAGAAITTYFGHTWAAAGTFTMTVRVENSRGQLVASGVAPPVEVV